MGLPTVAVVVVVVGTGRLGQEQVRARLLALATAPTTGWVPGPPDVAESSGVRRSQGLHVPSPDPATPPGPDRPAEVPAGPLGGFQARALASAVAAYTAAHGHPLEVEPFVDGVEARRWATRGRVAAVAAAALLVLGAVVVLRAVQETPSIVVPAAAGATAGATPGAEPAATPEVVVHVVGQVLQPGLVHLPAGARLADAIDAAGGAGPEADLVAINLARVLTDGEQVVVPRPGEQPQSNGAAGADGADLAIDLNTAATADLDTLPGIGPVLAQRIVDWRTEHGAFTAVDELAEVRGIGSALLEGLRDLVRVG
jgi:competence protein ComEA